MRKKTPIQYCSLDLELSGFDPSRDEILEVGFAFFTLTENGAQITEEWSQVFKPNRPVHPKILGLTGIKPEELEAAPRFTEFRDFLQEKLAKAIIVGHGIAMDIKFLEAFGLKLSGQFIDTLDLVQWILPTHHSYNLENLMHYFAVPHKEAHRALADSRATIAMLEKLLGVFSSFPPSLQDKIRLLVSQADFVWKNWLVIKLEPLTLPALTQTNQHSVATEVVLEKNTLVTMPFGLETEKTVMSSLVKLPDKSVLVVPQKKQALNLWKQGFGHGIFLPEDTFNKTKFENLLQSPALTIEHIKFLLKVLVWHHTNWQTETVEDLNLSFFGGQFRPLITDDLPPSHHQDQVLVCDHRTFLSLSSLGLFKGRHVVIHNLHAFEDGLRIGLGDKASWNYLLHILRATYNPETNFGELAYKEQVLQGLAATDLFFGLVVLHLHRLSPTSTMLSRGVLQGDPYLFNQLKQAANNYCAKLEEINTTLKLEAVTKFIFAIQLFFAEIEESQVRWIEFGDNHCILFTQPLDIAPKVQEVFKPYDKLTLTDTMPNVVVLNYLLHRFGLQTFQITPVQNALASIGLVQPQLLHENYREDKLSEYLKTSSLPALLVFDSSGEVKSFYDNNYQKLKSYASIFAEAYSGGSNKILRNFAISQQSVLAATYPFLFKNADRTLNLKTFVLTELPKESLQHPYTAALYEYWQKVFPNLGVLRLLQNLHTVFSMLNLHSLEHLIVYFGNNTQKSEESLVVKEYLDKLPISKIR